MNHAAAITDKGPFYHGTRAHLQIGDVLTPGFRSNYRPEVIMNHIYFTALVDGAGLAAELPHSVISQYGTAQNSRRGNRLETAHSRRARSMAKKIGEYQRRDSEL